MLMIRLARFGAKKRPHYRVVVIEKWRARDSKAIEIVGYYNPLTDPPTVKLKYDRIAYWRSVGAQLSDRVKKLLEHNPPPETVEVATGEKAGS